MMSMFKLYFVLCFACHRVWSLGVYYTCPTFQQGKNIISCYINRTAVIEAECFSLQEYVTFEKNVNGSSLVECLEQSFHASRCVAVQNPAANSCWCNATDGETFVYNYVYVASLSRDQGATFECKICHRPKNPLNVTASPNCSNMIIGTGNGGGYSNSKAGVSGTIVLCIIAVFVVCF